MPMKKRATLSPMTPRFVQHPLDMRGDTLTYAESRSHQWMMHEWVRDFCHAHGFQLNANKCKFMISDSEGAADPRFLWDVDGSKKNHATHQLRGLSVSRSLPRKIDPAQLRTS